jgi:hypothetical protein
VTPGRTSHADPSRSATIGGSDLTLREPPPGSGADDAGSVHRDGGAGHKRQGGDRTSGEASRRVYPHAAAWLAVRPYPHHCRTDAPRWKRACPISRANDWPVGDTTAGAASITRQPLPNYHKTPPPFETALIANSSRNSPARRCRSGRRLVAAIAYHVGASKP